MKALDWIRFLEIQNLRHGKVLFRIAELANVAGRSHHALNVELARLVKNGIISRYATGVYGLPAVVAPEQLMAVLDAEAYITGMYALYRHSLITQAPSGVTCFTNRRHNRSRQRNTLLGKWVFVCVSPRIYSKPAKGVVAAPEQALCDFVHLTARQGLNPSSLVTFRNIGRLDKKRLARLVKRYPATIGEIVRKLV